MIAVVKVAPTVLPVSLQELKDHLRITHDSQDTLLMAYLKAAINSVEQFTGLTLAQTTFTTYHPAFDYNTAVKKYPLNEIVSVKYYNASNVLTDFTDFTSDLISVPGGIVLTSLPATYDRSDAVTIEVKAGYRIIPDAVKAAILLHAGYLYDNPSDPPKNMLTASQNILRDFRIGAENWFN